MVETDETVKSEQKVKEENEKVSPVNMHLTKNEPQTPPVLEEGKPHSKSLTNVAGHPSDDDKEYKTKGTTSTKGSSSSKGTTGGERSKKRHSLASSNAESEIKLKRRKLNIAGAPKMPLTGYVRFMNDRREKLRREMPHKTSLEHTKIIGLEWTQMSMDLKQPYLKAAAEDKQKYLDEVKNFFDEHPELLTSELTKGKQTTNKKVATPKEKAQNAATGKAKNNKSKNATPATETIITPKTNPQPQQQQQQQQQKQQQQPQKSPEADPDEVPLATSFRLTKNKRTPTPTTTTNPTLTNVNQLQNNKNNGNGNGITITGTITQNPPPTTPSEIQIFTNEFLEHNRNMDTEIRTLRKQHSDLEQQNALLDKHVENTSVGLIKINNEIADIIEQNRLLEQYLTQTKEKLISVFASLPLPTERNGATSENFDKYIEDLHNMAASNMHSPALNKARDNIRKLELPTRPKF